MAEIRVRRHKGKTTLSFYTGTGRVRRLAQRVILDNPTKDQEQTEMLRVLDSLRTRISSVQGLTDD